MKTSKDNSSFNASKMRYEVISIFIGLQIGNKSYYNASFLFKFW